MEMTKLLKLVKVSKLLKLEEMSKLRESAAMLKFRKSAEINTEISGYVKYLVEMSRPPNSVPGYIFIAELIRFPRTFSVSL